MVKHRNRMISFVNMMMAATRGNGRIPVSRKQRNLGLQIWVSTVFQVSRQFLTSTCDILRKLLPLQLKYFYPRKEPALLTWFIADLQFWRRFTVASPQCSFKFLLGLMPFNPNELFSDACTSYGMAGVLRFGPTRRREQGIDGLF